MVATDHLPRAALKPNGFDIDKDDVVVATDHLPRAALKLFAFASGCSDTVVATDHLPRAALKLEQIHQTSSNPVLQPTTCRVRHIINLIA